MRALVLTHVFPRADGDPSAPFLGTWASALRAAGHDVRVIAPHDAGLPLVRRVEGVPVRFVRYAPDRAEVLAYRGEMHKIALRPTGPPLVAGLVGALARQVRRAVRRFDPEVLHVHWWLPGAVVARLAGVAVPQVVHLHGTDVSVVEGRPRLAPVARWALARAARVEVVSSDLAERAARALGVRAAAVNPMPLPEERLRPVPPATRPHGPARLLGVGRVVVEKGFGDLIAAAARLDRDVEVVILGEGPDLPRLRDLAAGLGVRASFPGTVPPADLPKAYAAADVVVQPSHREGLGLVAAEAAALGRPVVATDSGGVRDVLGGDGLVPVGDVAALAERLAAVLADPSVGQQAAPAIRDRLSPAAAVARTVAGWRAAVGDRAATHG